MTRYLILLVLSILSLTQFAIAEEPKEVFLSSTAEEIAALNSEPDYLIGGLVSPLSGQLVLRETDMIVKGAQNIVLSRTYIPPYMPYYFPKKKENQEVHNDLALYQHLVRCYKGWQFYPHLKLMLNSNQALLTDPNGTSLNYRLSDSGSELLSPFFAISNTSGDNPSGKYDPRNTRLTFEKNANRIIVHSPDGSTRFYYGSKNRTYAAKGIYLLEKEILPTGKILKFHYNSATEQIDRIESLDPNERFVYSSLEINGSSWEGNCHFTSSTQQEADYNYELRSKKLKFEEKKGTRKLPVTYPPILKSVSSPMFRNGSLDYCTRFLLGLYFGKDTDFSIINADYGQSEKHYRVHVVSLPEKETPNLKDSFVDVYEISYQPAIAGKKEGHTIVTNTNDETKTIYHFSKNLLTTSIQYFGEDGALKKEKIFSWDEGKQWLKTITMKDEHQRVAWEKSFEYDRFGNPIEERFTGDLTGEGNKETYTIIRTFSDDGRNLLLTEESENGKVICFSYLPNTNLVTSKLIKDTQTSILREFSVYDDCNNLIQKISDDGDSVDKDILSNVTQRTVETYTLRHSPPFLHMPEWITENCLEDRKEKLLKQTHLIYDKNGNVEKEEVFDANGQLRYTICKTYNERGDVLTETNRLGQIASYTYYPHGRLETATNSSHRLNKTFIYDNKKRLRTLTEKGDDGVVHTSFAKYSHFDQLLHKQDSFQNNFYYAYDPIANEVTKTDFPSIASPDGQKIKVATHSSYDPFGRALTHTDANGNVTTYRYNAYGSPTEIQHANGGKETFLYTKKGKLASHTTVDGLTIQYKYDVLDRVLLKTYISIDGEEIAQENFSYSGFNLVSSTDKEGHLTKYTYDGAGRKIREEFADKVTDFEYDALGRLATICKYNGDNTLLIHYTRDLEDKILEEYHTDASDNILYQIHYTYDCDGNLKTVTRFIDGKKAIQTFSYDSFHRLIETIDAEGHITQTSYKEDALNLLNQKVLQIAKTDPLQITTIETRDALDRMVKKEIQNPQKTTISSQEMTHDPHGNLLYQLDHVHENGLFQKTQVLKYTYNPAHQIESLTRAYGTKDARTTTYTYFPSGKIKTKTHPDGTTLSYTYDPLGFLSFLQSSDGKIASQFKRDLEGRITSCFDPTNTIERELDDSGNILKETFNHLSINKTYDAFDRLLSITLPDQSSIHYTYNPAYLLEIARYSPSHDKLYSHYFDTYDLNGDLLSEILITHRSQVQHRYDLKGQKTHIQNPDFNQECRYDPAGNLTSNIIDGTQLTYTYDDLSQLTSENNSNYAFDSNYNRTSKNGQPEHHNDLDELLNGCTHDLNGNLRLKKTSTDNVTFSYDPLNQLIECKNNQYLAKFTYDPLGRRLSKTLYSPSSQHTQYYLYHNKEELGAFTPEGQIEQLRIPGLSIHKDISTTIAVELEGITYATLNDFQGNIRRLVSHPYTEKAISYNFSAFGEGLNNQPQDAPFNPWCYACKRYDPEFNLVYFGKRFYDPQLGRWLTTDPAGFIDSMNLYQYLLNNPFRYIDQDGQFIQFAIPLLMWGAEVALPALSACAVPIISGAITGALLYGGYKVVEALNAKDDGYSPAEDYAQYVSKFDAECEEEQKKKYNTNPFEGPIDEDVVIVDEDGNAIKVPPGNWLTGTKDGKWIQEMKPGVGPKGQPTGQRKDGGGHPPPKHTDVRANKPHAHVPDVINPDGTDWLPIKSKK